MRRYPPPPLQHPLFNSSEQTPEEALVMAHYYIMQFGGVHSDTQSLGKSFLESQFHVVLDGLCTLKISWQEGFSLKELCVQKRNFENSMVVFVFLR